MGSKIEDWWEEEQKNPSEPAVEDEVKPYRSRVVGWLDILGMRKMIKDPENNPASKIMGIMNQLKGYLSSLCGKLTAEEKMDYLQIADGFMLVADEEYADKLCEIIAEIQWRILFEMKLISRGAITVGDVSVSKDGALIVGPAYVDAYALESTSAMFARVIVSKEFIDKEKKLTFKHICMDSDQTMYIDYVSYVLDSYHLSNEELCQEMLDKGVIAEIKDKRDRETNISVRQKYGWTMNLFDRHNLAYSANGED